MRCSLSENPGAFVVLAAMIRIMLPIGFALNAVRGMRMAHLPRHPMMGLPKRMQTPLLLENHPDLVIKEDLTKGIALEVITTESIRGKIGAKGKTLKNFCKIKIMCAS